MIPVAQSDRAADIVEGSGFESRLGLSCIPFSCPCSSNGQSGRLVSDRFPVRFRAGALCGSSDSATRRRFALSPARAILVPVAADGLPPVARMFENRRVFAMIHGPVAQQVRAPLCRRGGRRFEAGRGRFHNAIRHCVLPMGDHRQKRAWKVSTRQGLPDIMHAVLWPCSSVGQSAALSRRRSPVQVRSGSRCCVHSESRLFSCENGRRATPRVVVAVHSIG